MKEFKDWGFTKVEPKNYEKFQLRKNDIIIARTGASIGVNKFIKNDLNSVFNNGLIRIRVKTEKCTPEYLYYNFRSSNYNGFIDSISGGTSTQPNMQINALLSYEIYLPPLPEQRAIASVLSILDDKIDLLHRQNKTLEAMAETLFRQWFVEEAEEGWGEASLSDIAIFFNGKSRPKEDGNIPIYGGNGIFGYTNISNYSGTSIIIGRVGAYCGSLYFENREIWVSDNALLVKAKNKNQNHYLFYLLKTLELNSMAEGSSHPLLTQTLLKSIAITLPPKEMVVNFEYQLEQWTKKTESNQSQIRTLEKLRDTLLPTLMSGEVRLEV